MKIYSDDFFLSFLEEISKEHIYDVGGPEHTFHIIDYLVTPLLSFGSKAVRQRAERLIETILTTIKNEGTQELVFFLFDYLLENPKTRISGISLLPSMMKHL